MDVSESNSQPFLFEETSNDIVLSTISGTQRGQISEDNECSNQGLLKTKLSSAVWSCHATSMLVKLYEAKLEMLETPKKKTRIWIAISEDLKDHNVFVTPDQVRWKINALTKKYKHCLDLGKYGKFKYFKEMNNIYTKYNVDCDSYTITELLSKKRLNNKLINDTSRIPVLESRSMIEMRKARLANRINADKVQHKINLEKQWLQYLHRQEEQKISRDRVLERKLQLQQEILETQKLKIEINETLEMKRLQMMENELEDFLEIERGKCELLKQLLF